MNSRTKRNFVSALTFATALAGGVLTQQSTASADLFTCSSRAGFMRFRDSATNACGYVEGTNANWGSLPGGWNDRADQFGNDGRTSNVCIYQHASYRGTSVFLRRGYAVTWNNTVSSNRWTTGSGC